MFLKRLEQGRCVRPSAKEGKVALTPDHIPRMDVELRPGSDARADCGGRLRRIDMEEDQETVRGTVFPTTDRRTGICPRALAIVLGPGSPSSPTKRIFDGQYSRQRFD